MGFEIGAFKLISRGVLLCCSVCKRYVLERLLCVGVRLGQR
jgi:hypothetical protein